MSEDWFLSGNVFSENVFGNSDQKMFRTVGSENVPTIEQSIKSLAKFKKFLVQPKNHKLYKKDPKFQQGNDYCYNLRFIYARMLR